MFQKLRSKSWLSTVILAALLAILSVFSLFVGATEINISSLLSGGMELKIFLLAMYNNNAMRIMDTQSQLNILAAELGGNNLGEAVGEVDKATHGEDASWETIVNLNPE